MNEKDNRANQKPEDDSRWHTMQADEVMKELDVGENGLTREEVRKRLDEFGPNKLPTAKKRGPVKRFLIQFNNILIYVLLVAAAVTAFLGHWLDMGVILGVVVINAIIGFIQEGKAEKALEALQKMLSLTATVLRDGRKEEIPAEEIVPGDVLLFASGDKISADVRLIRTKNLKIEESVLTGESEAVEKSLEPAREDAVLGDRYCMAFSSTLVTYGSGRGVVVATGADTEIGKINKMLSEVEQLTTPLLRQITKFGHWLTAVILGLSLLTFAFGFFVMKDEPAELFLSVVALAVAAIPEGLPAILTIALAIGVQRMAKRNAIIRRLPAVETLGAVTVIFSDKTGTLTRNEMTAKKVVTASGDFHIEGSGYKPEGEFKRDDKTVSVNDHPVLKHLLQVGFGCNEATIKENEEGAWVLSGDPTEGALITLGMKAGFGRESIENDLPRIDDIPFESERRYMATLHKTGGGSLIFLKGGPERVLGMCNKQATDDGEVELDESFWRKKSEETAAEGHRLLALAMKKLSENPGELKTDDVESGMVFLGFVGIYDPRRDEATEAVRKCKAAGIQVKMVTGDHALTATAIGRELGLAGDDDEAVVGSTLEKTSDEELDRIVPKTNVFARVNPEHKLRLVKAMQDNNHIVAMTGDGVNDAPALKRADVGVAMGIKGTEVSKDSSEMVLTDDNFASIANAVEEGRTVYDNLRKAILFLLPTNGGQASLIVVAILFGLTRPLTPVQALWINMITAVTLALSLAFEPPEQKVMNRKPRDPSEPILPVFFLWRIAFVSFLLLISALGLFHWELERGASLEVARTAAVNMVFFGQAFYLFNSRFIIGSSMNIGVFFGNRYIWVSVVSLVVIQLLYTYWPVMQTLFETGPLSLDTWSIILAAGLLIFLLVEVEKLVVRGWNGKK